MDYDPDLVLLITRWVPLTLLCKIRSPLAGAAAPTGTPRSIGCGRLQRFGLDEQFGLPGDPERSTE